MSYSKSFTVGLFGLSMFLIIVVNCGIAAAQMYISSNPPYVSKEKHRGITPNVVMQFGATKKQFDDLMNFIKAEVDANCPPPKDRSICDGIDAEQIRIKAVKFAQENKIPYAFMNLRAPSMPRVS